MSACEEYPGAKNCNGYGILHTTPKDGNVGKLIRGEHRR